MALSGSLSFISASITGASDINADFVGLNTLIVDPITASTNILGQPGEQSPVIYYNSEVVGQNINPQPNYLNFLLLNRNGPYQHSSWKQYRGGDHPIARNLRLHNTMSIDTTYADPLAREQEKKFLRYRLENDTHQEVNEYLEALNNTLATSEKNPRFYQQPTLNRFYEPAVVKAHKPFIYDIQGAYRIRSTFMNQMIFFENKEVNQALSIAGPDRYTGSFDGRPTRKPKQEYYNFIEVAKENGASGFIYSETIFPKPVNVFRPYKLEKLSYEESAGTGPNGYDRAVNRSFWRDAQPTLQQKITSSGMTRFRTEAAALNSQDVIQVTTTPTQTSREGFYDLIHSGSVSSASLGWNFAYRFMEPGIIVHSGIATTTNSAGDGMPTLTKGGVPTASAPGRAFATFESYQPHPISLFSMWPLDARPDIYGSAPYLTSSHGGFGKQIGLTPHRMREDIGHPSNQTFVTDNSVFVTNHIGGPREPGPAVVSASGGKLPSGMPGGNLYSTVTNATGAFAQIENILTGTAGELVYSTKPTMFFHRTGSITQDLKGYRAQTASLQYNRHTFPYNTPFYATNLIRGRNPFYNSYADFAQDMKLHGRDYSYVPEHKTSNNIQYYYERYFKNQMQKEIYTEFKLSSNFNLENVVSSFYDSQAATEQLGDGSFVTLSPSVIKRNVTFPISRKPKDFKLNFLSLDGAFVTASSDLESLSGSSENTLAYKYVALSKDVATSTLQEELGFKNSKKAVSYLQDVTGVIFNEAFSHTDTGQVSNLIAAPMNNGFDTVPAKIRFTAHGLKKLRPEKNFYPVLKTVDIGNKFKQFIYNNIQSSLGPEHGDGQTNDRIVQAGQDSGQLQSFLEPFFAPGILYNSIKSGIAVDYPVYSKKPTYFAPWVFFSGSLEGGTNYGDIEKDSQQYGRANSNQRFLIQITSSFNYGGFYMMGASRCIPAILNNTPDFRMPFEALYDTSILKQKYGIGPGHDGDKIYLTTDFLDLDINYPEGAAATASAAASSQDVREHPGAAFTYTGPRSQLMYMADDNTEQFLYEASVNNFLSETMNFFLKDQDELPGQKLPVFVSDYRQDSDINIDANSEFAMEVSLRMGRHQVMAEGPRDSGIGGESFGSNPSGFEWYGPREDARGMRGYIYGPPVEIVKMSGSANVFPRESYNESTGKISRQEPLVRSDFNTDGTWTGLGDYESYFAANLTDPAYQTYTPPYFYGKSSLVVTAVSGSNINTWNGLFKQTDQNSYYLDTYQTGSKTQQDFDELVRDSLCAKTPGTGSVSGLSSTRMKIDSSVDIFNKADINYVRPDTEIKAFSWYVNPKWVCPVLDFSSSFSAVSNRQEQGLLAEKKETVTFVTNSYHDMKTGRGMWGGYGSDPYDTQIQKEIQKLRNESGLSKGIYLKINDLASSKTNNTNALSYKTDISTPSEGVYVDMPSQNTNEATGSLISQLGLQASTKEIGQFADSKTISEALVIVPYFDKPVRLRGNDKVPSGEIFVTREIIPGKHFLPIHNMLFDNMLSMALAKRKYGLNRLIANLNASSITRKEHLGFESEASYNEAASTDVFKMIETLLGDEQKGIPGYELPVELDFINYRQAYLGEKVEEAGPFQMIVVPFEHELSKQELMDIYQGVMPDSSLAFEKAASSIELNLSPNNRHSWMPKTKGAQYAGTAPGVSLNSINPANFLDPSYLYSAELRKYVLDTDLKSEWIKTSRDFYKNLKFMTFKIKQRGIKDYQNYKNRQIERAVLERTRLRIPDVEREELGLGFNTSLTLKDTFGYNWPYDDFSLMEAFKLDIRVEIED